MSRIGKNVAVDDFSSLHEGSLLRDYDWYFSSTRCASVVPPVQQLYDQHNIGIIVL